MKLSLGSGFSSICARFCGRVCSGYRIIRSWIICRLWGFKTNGRVLIAGPIFVRIGQSGSVTLGEGVRMFSTRNLNAICQNCTVIDTRKGGLIMIGERTGLSSATLVSRKSITIGKRVLIGANTCIFDHNFHALKSEDRIDRIRDDQNVKSASVIIDDDCFIGMNCIILKGTHIGAGSIVAAGSVIFGLDIPPNSLVRGNPARIEQENH